MNDTALSNFYAAIAAYGTWATVVAALIVLFFQNRHAQKLAYLQIVNELVVTYNSDELNKKRANLATALLNDRESINVDDSILVFYEHIALMVNRKLLDLDLTYNIFGMDVIYYLAALNPYIENIRRELDDKSLYDQCEWLRNLFLRERVRRGLPDLTSIDYEGPLKRFLQMEISRHPGP
ncbi:DUF4760 domain-containing protein [uncultured Thiodictyon sp.]|uniref:DUF4760 domain-containing protein n=1 Tax=uncultured Thiodictyon sp. TaxID=1846217 RepID=UPI0025FA543F|nr:DUF4760 domain-containing protein [uncultured Thiodictyon sp.]